MNSLRHTKQTSAQIRPSPAQLSAIHSLFSLYVSSGLMSSIHTAAPIEGATNLPVASGKGATSVVSSVAPFRSVREQRLEWASGIVGRPLDSFSLLRADEAAWLIDLMKKALGQEITPAPRRRPDRDQAHAYGTAGRRANASNEIRIVDASTLELLDDLLTKLGWTHARLDAFLCSSSSPVRTGAIRTLPEANRVIWALKNMLRRSHTQNSRAERKDKKFIVQPDSRSHDEECGTGWLF